MNGLQYLICEDRQRRLLPLYYVFGYKGELRTLNQYIKVSKKARAYHRSAYTKAVSLTRHLEANIVLHHIPLLA